MNKEFHCARCMKSKPIEEKHYYNDSQRRIRPCCAKCKADITRRKEQAKKNFAAQHKPKPVEEY